MCHFFLVWAIDGVRNLIPSVVMNLVGAFGGDTPLTPLVLMLLLLLLRGGGARAIAAHGKV